MSLRQFLSILRARSRLALSVLLAVMLLAVAWLALRSPVYVARAPVLVDVRTDPVGTTPWQGMVAPSYLATQIDIVKSRRVAERVVELLPPDQEPMVRLRERAAKRKLPKEWLADALQSELEVKPARESNIISISWRGRSPNEAARVANAFAQAYLDTNLNLKTAPAKRYTEYFDQQQAQARERLEKAQARLAEYQQKVGLISSTEQGDYERQRLAELTAQLIAVQTRPRGGDASSDAGAGPVVNNLRGEVARLESKVNEASATMGPNHPKLQQLEAELRSMRGRLSAESARSGQAAAAGARAAAGRIRDLEAQIAAQKARVLSTTRERGDLSVLQQEVQSAQKAYETVAEGAAQSRLQGMTTQGNVLFLGAAGEPLQPSGPSSLLVVLIALAGGTVLGIAAALVAELARRRVRSVQDLEMVTQLPVLGVVPVRRADARALQLAQQPRRLAFNGQGRLA